MYNRGKKEESPKKEDKTNSEKKTSGTLHGSFSAQQKGKSDSRSDKCLICKKDGHRAVECFTITKLKSGSERSKYLDDKKISLCRNCMKGPHHSGECRQESRCQKCGKKHHSLLHFERSQAHHAMGARPRQEGSQPSEPSREPENGPVVAAATSQPVGATPILQCCLAWALSPDGGIKKLARVFFDSGSELAMVRRDLANKLGLDGPCHRLTLTGVGGVNLPSTMEKRVKFQLQDLSGTYTSHPIEAVTKEKLTEKMREIRVNPSEFSHLRGIHMLMKSQDKRWRSTSSLDVTFSDP